MEGTLISTASSLIAAEEARERFRPAPASSGLAAIDKHALDGGFRYGEITSIAGAPGVGKTLLAFHAIASHLLHSGRSEVAVIDTTGTFSPLRLRDVLLHRLREGVGSPTCQAKDLTDVKTTHHYTETATKYLDRVKVMRVFDFTGVVEAIGEVGQMWEMEEQKDGKARALGASQLETGAVDNSEEDSCSCSSSNDALTVHSDNPEKESEEQSPDTQSGGIGMFVIDTITNVANSMISQNHLQGQSLLVNFFRSLHHQTVNHHMCTLIINAAVGLNISREGRSQDNASIFASTMGRPALGRIFAQLIDTSIFVSLIPKGTRDAEFAYRPNHKAVWEKVGVIEVLEDRYGARAGQWATFQEVNAVEIRSLR